ncbi:phosphatase PAP2 family protein [Phreatobacter sp.]|uniref:phosphatase PAP2 family protein n=1 Tax=Phreatobacter sp. TaxID=1966341 RepID=UPI0025E569C6|nr:phosphatase PAP2 family protein [Phreatobacter sp.]
MTNLASRFGSRFFRLLRDEIGLVIALVVIAGGILAFLRLADVVGEGESQAFDRALLLLFRDPANLAQGPGPGWLPGVMRDITALGGFAVLTLIVVVTAVYLVLVGKRASALFVVLAVMGGTLLSHGLKMFFDRPRPDLIPQAPVELTASFPSGHAMISAVTYLTLGVLLTRLDAPRRVHAYFLTVAVLMTVMIGISRIYLGVHWPTDVLAGWCLGAAWALFCWLVALWLQRRGQMDRAKDRA